MDRKKIQNIINLYQECRPSLEAMGDKVRQEIVIMLADAGFNGMNVLDITSQLKISRPAVSHHLKILKDIGIIAIRKKGTSNYYYLSVEKRLIQMQHFLNSINELTNSPEFKHEKAEKIALGEYPSDV